MEEKTVIEKPTLRSFLGVFLISAFLLVSIFLIRQMFFWPVNFGTIIEMALEGTRQKINPLKKYFPKPYSIQDIARGDYDRH